MTMGQRDSDARDIVQTRAFTAQEKRELGRLWEKVIWREGVGPLYTISSYLWYGFGAFLAVSILMAATTLNDTKPSLALQLAAAAIGYGLSLVFTHWMGRRLWQQKYWSAFDAGDRYTLEVDGIQAETRRGRLWCGWQNIETIIRDDRRLLAALKGQGALFILKAAFEGQDAESFGAELVRRWQASRSSSQSEAVR